jgi:hypothetical protein
LIVDPATDHEGLIPNQFPTGTDPIRAGLTDEHDGPGLFDQPI